MCNHSTKKWRWAINAKGQKQIAAYCQHCDMLLFWGSKVAGSKSQQLKLPLKTK